MLNFTLEVLVKIQLRLAIIVVDKVYKFYEVDKVRFSLCFDKQLFRIQPIYPFTLLDLSLSDKNLTYLFSHFPIIHLLWHPPLLKRGITPCQLSVVCVSYQWSVVGGFFQDILLGKEILYLPISHSLIYPFNFVNGVDEPCRSSDQFFIEEEFYLLISHFLLTYLLLLAWRKYLQ